MTNVNTEYEFDRSIRIEGEGEIDKFILDPQGYLSDRGALDGLPEFNGVVNFDTPEGIESLRDRPGMSCWHIVGPVHGFCRWFCVSD